MNLLTMQPNFEVIRPSGVLDLTQANQLRDQVNELMNAGASTIVINLEDVTFMDSSGLAALVIALKTIRAAGKQLYVCCLNAQVKMLFELTNMTKIFEIFETQDEVAQAVGAT
jgi:anti-sigma B factor antagonist